MMSDKGNKTIFSVGFLFNNCRDKVVLVKKKNPEWQRDKYNGIGGHLESGEDIVECMRREASEELKTDEIFDWKRFCVVSDKEWQLHVFKACSNWVYQLPSRNDRNEELTLVRVDDARNMRAVTLYNTPWLLEMALDDSVILCRVKSKLYGE